MDALQQCRTKAAVLPTHARKEPVNYTTQCSPVVWKASSTIPSSLSDAAKWKTEKMFFQPDLMLVALEWTICATQRTTMSRMVSDLEHNVKITVTQHQGSGDWNTHSDKQERHKGL